MTPRPIASDDSLSGRVAIVTGAGGGLGGVMLKALADCGARPVGIDINASALDRLGSKMAGRDLLRLALDVADEGACRDAVGRVIERWGRVDILVNCAGIAGEQPDNGPFPRFWERNPANWRAVQAINNNGAFHMAYHTVRPMLDQGRGRIINISTSLATMLRAGMAAYGPSKAAMEAGAAIWAKELAGTGVTVNVLLPGGPVATPLVPASLFSDTLLQPKIMVPPLLWLVSDASLETSGRRFIALEWDTRLPPDEAAARCSYPAGWAE
jgi:NAD(P)-dependent dehydrogenase (short-subunit alcohol dehydrogenase family)